MMYSQKYFDDIAYTMSGNMFEELRGKSLLITGSTGLIGSALIDTSIWLNEDAGYGVRVLAASRDEEAVRSRFRPFSERDYFKSIRYEATEPFILSEHVDYVICAAGNAHPGIIGREPVETLLANLVGVHNLLEYARGLTYEEADRSSDGNPRRRLLYVSSSEVYGQKDDDQPYAETDYGYVDILNPRSCYPCSKRAAEALCAAYQAEYGVDSVIVRPGHVYGPTQTERDSRASAQFLRAAARGEDIVMKSPGIQMRSYCHCLDCASAILTVLMKGTSGEAYNISNPKSIISIRQFAELCAAISGHEVRYEPPSEEESASYNVMDNSALDSEKLERLGWRGAWDAAKGIKESINIIKNEDLSVCVNKYIGCLGMSDTLV